MKMFSAVDWNGGNPEPRRAYGIEAVPTGTLHAVTFDKQAAEDYLRVAQQTTKPEHWRIVRLGLSR